MVHVGFIMVIRMVQLDEDSHGARRFHDGDWHAAGGLDCENGRPHRPAPSNICPPALHRTPYAHGPYTEQNTPTGPTPNTIHPTALHCALNAHRHLAYIFRCIIRLDAEQLNIRPCTTANRPKALNHRALLAGEG